MDIESNSAQIINANQSCDFDDLVHEDDSVDREKYNLVGICRICFIKDPHMINLWSTPTEKFDEDFQHIKDILANFSSVAIDENENLSHLICEKCEANIYFTYTFKRKCENSEEILRNAIILNTERKLGINTVLPDYQERIVEAQTEIDITINSVKNDYQCEQCSDVFAQRVLLNQHVKQIHKRNKCDECGKYFAQPQILRRHRKIHFGVKNKSCSICGKCFFRSDDLKRHVRVHTGEKPFSCDQCTKSYKQSSELIQHKLTHSNVKQFNCKLCEKSMSTRSGYYIHMKVHNGQKNHHCNFCDKKFVTKSERNSHVQYIHLKVKRFECTIPDCPKRFVTKISLNKHLKTHSRILNKFYNSVSTQHVHSKKILEYECSICSQQLLSLSMLKKHIKLHDIENNGEIEDEHVSTNEIVLIE